MSKSTKSYLADVNVWIALAYGRHLHHDLVRRWFDSLPGEGALFCRLTQLGFLRLLTTRSVMGADTVSQRQAWELYDQVMVDSRVAFLPEPAELEPAFRRLTRSPEPAGKVWTDAYLAAMASAAGLSVATLDRGLAATGGIDVMLLKD